MKFLITGGVGYLGSHVALALLTSYNYDVVLYDNLSNSSFAVASCLENICGRPIIFVQGDIRDRVALTNIFREHKIDAVLHFAGLKSISESVLHPLKYYDHNVHGTLALCQVMASLGVYNLVFSSSAIVYGTPENVPISENAPTNTPTNPYGKSKFMVEEILKDLAKSDHRWSIALLRYFNPIGAHESGLLGEDPRGTPNNLLPYVTQVAIGRLKKLTIFGNDYPTKDGTGIRDYIHVMDLASGHKKALDLIALKRGIHIWNLGTGKGYSVLDVISTFEKVTGKTIPYEFAARREGDVAECWADPTKAETDLGWKAKRGLEEMLRDSWRWQVKNPYGY